ncbi:hypothetical protein ABGT16_05115 [Pseudomonas asiatica]|uniref:hypothetical protein n=1 Tax=Pseudomonas asiatica TaxID=2219225 RepID=UPI00345CFC6D
MELVRYVLTDPQSDCEWVRRDHDEVIAIAERVGATRFQGITILRVVVQIDKQRDRWVPGPLQMRSLSYEDVCGHYQRILSANPKCGLQIATHGVVFLDVDGLTLLKAPYKADGVTIDDQCISDNVLGDIAVPPKPSNLLARERRPHTSH